MRDCLWFICTSKNCVLNKAYSNRKKHPQNCNNMLDKFIQLCKTCKSIGIHWCTVLCLMIWCWMISFRVEKQQKENTDCIYCNRHKGPSLIVLFISPDAQVVFQSRCSAAYSLSLSLLIRPISSRNKHVQLTKK